MPAGLRQAGRGSSSADLRWGRLNREPAGASRPPCSLTTRFIALELRHRLPAVYATEGSVTAGGLVSYGQDFEHNFRQTAEYVDRILRGEKPSDLPVQQPTKYKLVVNLKTAKAIGLDVSPTLLARADEVIE